LKYEITSSGEKALVRLRDQLVHQDRTQFERVVGEALSGRPRAVDVDFSEVSYMDSAGLGFLLTLRERAGQQGVPVSLCNPRGAVKEMLDLARFDTLFAIREQA